jgi:hypothetical protein
MDVAKHRERTFTTNSHRLLPEGFSDFPMVACHEPNPF